LLFKLWVVSHHLVDNPKDKKSFLFLIAPDWLLHIIWRIKGDFVLKCEHVARGEKPYIIMPVSFYKKGKLLYRAKVMLCRDCAMLLP